LFGSASTAAWKCDRASEYAPLKQKKAKNINNSVELRTVIHADPDPDPDLGSQTNANPDPGSQTNADPDTGRTLKSHEFNFDDFSVTQDKIPPGQN
jgi:hypothetical protein